MITFGKLQGRTVLRALEIKKKHRPLFFVKTCLILRIPVQLFPICVERVRVRVCLDKIIGVVGKIQERLVEPRWTRCQLWLHLGGAEEWTFPVVDCAPVRDDTR